VVTRSSTTTTVRPIHAAAPDVTVRTPARFAERAAADNPAESRGRPRTRRAGTTTTAGPSTDTAVAAGRAVAVRDHHLASGPPIGGTAPGSAPVPSRPSRQIRSGRLGAPPRRVRHRAGRPDPGGRAPCRRAARTGPHRRSDRPPTAAASPAGSGAAGAASGARAGRRTTRTTPCPAARSRRSRPERLGRAGRRAHPDRGRPDPRAAMPAGICGQGGHPHPG
jgi:hypothetical protein